MKHKIKVNYCLSPLFVEYFPETGEDAFTTLIPINYLNIKQHISTQANIHFFHTKPEKEGTRHLTTHRVKRESTSGKTLKGKSSMRKN